MTPLERETLCARGRECMAWLTDDELIQHVGMLEVVTVQRMLAKGATAPRDAHGSGPIDGDLAAALLDVRWEMTAEEREASNSDVPRARDTLPSDPKSAT